MIDSKWRNKYFYLSFEVSFWQLLSDSFPYLWLCSLRMHLFFAIEEVELLRAKDRAWPAESYPADKVSCVEMIVFHGVHTDKSACSSESSLTMYSNGTRLLFSYIQKVIDYGSGRICTVSKVQFIVSDAFVFKFFWIVSLIIKANHCRNAHFLEDRDVVFGSKALCASVVFVFIIGGTKSDKLTRDDPVKVAILQFLIVFVLSYVKFAIIEPPEPYSIV